jgi:prevent-host-death family protein
MSELRIAERLHRRVDAEILAACNQQTIGHKILVMSAKKRDVATARKGSPDAGGKRLAAGEFKARCLQLMDRVRERGEEYVITKHGKPVAKLVPFREPKQKSFLGCMKGTVLKYERPFDPIEGEWDI